MGDWIEFSSSKFYARQAIISLWLELGKKSMDWIEFWIGLDWIGNSSFGLETRVEDWKLGFAIPRITLGGDSLQLSEARGTRDGVGLRDWVMNHYA